MPATFHASDVFTLKSKERFVVIGKIVDGIVREGMSMRIEGHPGVALPIVGIGSVRKIGDSGVLGLSTPYRDLEELASLQALELTGKVIFIEEPAAP